MQRTGASLAAGIAVFAGVVVLALASPVPSEDGVSYLWMAQRFAAGAFAEAFAPVFPPGFPLLLAPFVALGLAPEVASMVLNATCLAACVVPLARLARLVHAEAPVPAVVLFACSPLLLRVAAECYSEPAFLLLMAWGTCLGAQRRWWWLGLCSGLAFLVRPEGVLLAASFVLADPRAAWRALLPAAAVVVGLASWRTAHGLPFDLLPLVEFHEGRDDLPERGQLGWNLLQVPVGWFEAFGVAALVVWFAPWRRLAASAAMRWQIVLQVGAICSFVVRRRFFLSCAVPVFAFAGAALARWPAVWRRTSLTIAVVAGAVVAWRGRIDADRAIERTLGAWFAAQLAPHECLFADRPRILYFAGRPPGPPRHHTGEQLQQLIAAQAPRFLVLTARASGALQAADAGFASRFAAVTLPEPLASGALERRFAIFERR